MSEDNLERLRQLLTQSQEELKDNTELLRLAHRIGRTGTFEWVFKDNRVNITPELAALYGIDPEEFGGDVDKLMELVHPEDIPRVKEAVEKALITDDGYHAEFRVIGLDNRVYWIEARGKVFDDDGDGVPDRMLGINMDISERVSLGRTAEERKAMLEAVYNAALDAIIVMGSDGEVIEWNHAAETMFGHKRVDALGQQLAELIIPESMRQAHYEGLQHLAKTGEGPILEKRINLSALRQDGTEFPVELTVVPVSKTFPTTFVGFIRDLTQRPINE